MSDSQKNILLVDDDSFVRDMIGFILESEDYNVTSAENGKQALDIYTKNPKDFDLIITDINMPELSGPELIKEIHKENENIPVIFLSGNDEKLENFVNNKNKNIKQIIKDDKIQDTIIETTLDLLSNL